MEKQKDREKGNFENHREGKRERWTNRKGEEDRERGERDRHRKIQTDS